MRSGARGCAHGGGREAAPARWCRRRASAQSADPACASTGVMDGPEGRGRPICSPVGLLRHPLVERAQDAARRRGADASAPVHKSEKCTLPSVELQRAAGTGQQAVPPGRFRSPDAVRGARLRAWRRSGGRPRPLVPPAGFGAIRRSGLCIYGSYGRPRGARPSGMLPRWPPEAPARRACPGCSPPAGRRRDGTRPQVREMHAPVRGAAPGSGQRAPGSGHRAAGAGHRAASGARCGAPGPSTPRAWPSPGQAPDPRSFSARPGAP